MRPAWSAGTVHTRPWPLYLSIGPTSGCAVHALSVLSSQRCPTRDKSLHEPYTRAVMTSLVRCMTSSRHLLHDNYEFHFRRNAQKQHSHNTNTMTERFRDCTHLFITPLVFHHAWATSSYLKLHRAISSHSLKAVIITSYVIYRQHVCVFSLSA